MKRVFPEPTTVVFVSGWKGSGKDTFSDHLVNEYQYTKVSFAAKLKDEVAAKYGLDRASLDDQSLKELPLPNMPVIGKDHTSRVFQSPLVTHFRTLDGREPKITKTTQAGYFESTRNLFISFLPRFVADYVVHPTVEHPIIRYDANDNLFWGNEQLFWTRRALMILVGCVGRSVNPDCWVDGVIPEGSSKIVISDFRFENEYARLESVLENCILYKVRIDTVVPSTSTDPSERSLDNYTGFDTRILNTMDGLELFYEKIEQNEIVQQITCKRQKNSQ